MTVEKRKNVRFFVREDVIVAFRNGFNRIGKVKDISMEGLSFEHIYDEDSNWVHSNRNIVLWVNDFNMSKIPCRVVYNIPIGIPSEYDSLTIQFIPRRCGVQFETLAENQRAQLEFFLKNYTKEKA